MSFSHRMETDLSARIHAYATAAEAAVTKGTHLYADALSCSRSASAAASAAIICSHTREWRGDAGMDHFLPDHDELDVLIAGKGTGKPENLRIDRATGEPFQENSARIRLPLHPGKDSLTNLALGATGIPVIKAKAGNE